jgi:predicted transposase/invertase (TIGR01784 family)
MHTDTPFYRLFQERPALVFELAGLPVPADLDYRLHAEEVKQTAFRLDGVLRPEAGRDDLPLVFVETQFQHRANFYARWFASIFLYLFRHPGITRSWRAVVVFPDHATDSGTLAPYEPLLNCGLLHRVYLADLLDDPAPGFGTRLARLVVMEPAIMVAEARALLAEPGPEDLRANTLDLIETILVYKFPKLSRDEIRTMLHLPQTELKKTRFYQEVFHEGHQEGREEGREEGRQQGEARVLLRLITRKFGPPSEAVREQIATADPETLLRWSERILIAQTLDEVLHSPRPPVGAAPSPRGAFTRGDTPPQEGRGAERPAHKLSPGPPAPCGCQPYRAKLALAKSR